MKFIPTLRFLVLSDIHCKDEPSKESERLALALKSAYSVAGSSEDYKKLDALYIVGDFANSGSEKQMKLVDCVLADSVKSGTQVTLTMASHEFKDSGEAAALERFARIFGEQPDTHRVINGFHFIAVTTTDGCHFSEEKCKWIADELALAAADDPKKPIFFFQHPHITDTVYGSINWGEDEITAILMNYPQIIDFSGHSHAPINDPRSIHQRHFTCVGTGSLSYFELDEFDKADGTVPPFDEECAQMTIVEADAENRVRIYPYDLITDSFFPQVRSIDCPSEPSTFIYTDERYKTSVTPYFPDSAEIKAEVTGNKCTLTFDTADIDEDYVDDYKITVRRSSDGAIAKQICMWSPYYLKNMPETVTQDIDGLAPGSYTVNVTAKSVWKNASRNSLETAFTI